MFRSSDKTPNQRLLTAIQNGNITEANSALEQKADPNDILQSANPNLLFIRETDLLSIRNPSLFCLTVISDHTQAVEIAKLCLLNGATCTTQFRCVQTLIPFPSFGARSAPPTITQIRYFSLIELARSNSMKSLLAMAQFELNWSKHALSGDSINLLLQAIRLDVQLVYDYFHQLQLCKEEQLFQGLLGTYDATTRKFLLDDSAVQEIVKESLMAPPNTSYSCRIL